MRNDVESKNRHEAWSMRQKELVQSWLDAFNRTAADTLAAFYRDNAINQKLAWATSRPAADR